MIEWIGPGLFLIVMVFIVMCGSCPWDDVT